MGKVIGIPNMNPDLSAEKFAEEKFRLAVEACPNGMVMTDGADTIVLVNGETERLFGYQRDELVGRSVEMLIPRRLRGEYLRLRAAFALRPEAGRVQPSRELYGVRRDGNEFPIEVWFNPIRTRDGLFTLSFIVDVSERRRMEKLKDEFVSTVSHELRTPLTSIAGSLGLLIGGAAGQLPDAAVRLLSIAQANSQRLVRLINDILDIEKIESGRVVFDFRRFEARALTEQVIEANRSYADNFAVGIRLDTRSVAAEVYADQDRLAQVLTNLLSNAIKFSPRDGEVVVAVEQHADRVRISVRDHGDGIPEKFIPHVFEKFAQADATDARQKGGTGLGLSIVKEIVTRLGGEVGFAKADGGGTVFYVELLEWARIAAQENDSAAAPDSARILFCEDDPEAALALRRGLRPLGFGTDFAHSPAEALTQSRSGSYAAIVVDFELPDGGGAGLIHRLRELPQYYNTPIVIASAQRPGAADDAARLSVLHWLPKPVDAYQLAQVLDNAVRGVERRPCILHVDDDCDVLDLVAHTLEPDACVVSAGSIDEARHAQSLNEFDLVVLDITLRGVSGLDLLPELRRRNGTPIPVIIFSAHAAELAPDARIEARLSKSRAALDELVTAVHDRLRLGAAPPRQEVA